MSAPLSAEQIGLVRSSFDAIAPNAEKVVALFYGRLFSERPDLQSLFKGSMQEQGHKLAAALATVIASLDRLDTIAPVLREMGRRHAGYGVRDADYADVGGALVWTLEAGLGSAFDADLRDAWAKAYGLLADTMKAGAAPDAPHRKAS